MVLPKRTKNAPMKRAKRQSLLRGPDIFCVIPLAFLKDLGPDRQNVSSFLPINTPVIGTGGRLPPYERR